MKIGIYCTNNIVYPVPAGTIYANMQIAGVLADKLVDLGHEVTFFAPIGTQTKAKLVTFNMLPFSEKQIFEQYNHPSSSYQYENIMLIQALNYSEEHEIEIFQSHTRPFSIIDFAPLKPNLPVVITVHDPLSDDAYKLFPNYQQFDNLYFTSISKAQEKTCAGINWYGTIYNGIDENLWQFSDTHEDYLLYVGRILPDKGADSAVEIALKTNHKLLIAGSFYEKDHAFFDEKIKPFLGEQIQHLGSISQSDLIPYYQKAKALLLPLRWEEPFGLVMIEAMASGTPVITTNHGAAPEIVIDGQTGYIVKDGHTSNDFVNSVNSLDQINRADCRKHVEDKFTLNHMAQNYASLYKTILG